MSAQLHCITGRHGSMRRRQFIIAQLFAWSLAFMHVQGDSLCWHWLACLYRTNIIAKKCTRWISASQKQNVRAKEYEHNIFDVWKSMQPCMKLPDLRYMFGLYYLSCSLSDTCHWTPLCERTCHLLPPSHWHLQGTSRTRVDLYMYMYMCVTQYMYIVYF